jgi:hypothetical protein
MKNWYLLLALILLSACSVDAPAQVSAPTSKPAASPAASPAKSDHPSVRPTDTPTEAAPAKADATKSAKSGVTLPPEKSRPIQMVRFAKPPVIDGKLDDEVWKQAVVLKDFYQIQPGDNIAPSQRTEVMLGFDAKFIYIAFHCYDEPSKVRANIAKRDNIFDDDYVGILFDTFNDNRKAYEFDFNPLGIQADGVWTDGQGEDFNPDIVMESKGMVTEDGWTVEVAIPFKSLRYVAGKDKLWGAHFWRRIKRYNNELDMWMPINRDISSWLAQAGRLTGLEGISTERTLELIPSLTLSETGKRRATLTPAQLSAGLHDPGRFVNAPIKFDPGLTGKYSITPNVTLDFALNPDFAQVEADQTVVTANQRFPIFFAEKRPFFLEGIDIFNTAISAVHTRAIIDPDVAVKLSGKINRNTFGLLVASDNGPGNLSEDDRAYIITNPLFILGINDSDVGAMNDVQKAQLNTKIAAVRFRQAQLRHLLDKNSLVGILRLKHDIGAKDSFIGFLGTTYNFAGTYNQLASFDGRQRINPQTTLSWQVIGTSSLKDFFFPDRGTSLLRRENGLAYEYDYSKDGRHFGYELSGVGRTRFFRSDVGFNRRTNTNNENLFVRYNSEPKPKAKLVSWRVYYDLGGNFNWQGQSQNYNHEAQLQFNLQRNSSIGVGVDKGYERVFEEEFGAKRQPGQNCLANECTFAGADNERSANSKGFYMFANSTVNKQFRFSVFAYRSYGNLDYDFGAGQRFPRVSPVAIAARQTGGNAPLDPGPGRSFHIDGNIRYQPLTPLNFQLSFTKERLRRYDTNLLAFDENIVSLKSTYQFSRFVFARARVDYDTLASSVRGQFLFGYTPNPGTAFYVGYNDDMNRDGFNPFSHQLEPGFRRNGRTFFIKMSYLFRHSFQKA